MTHSEIVSSSLAELTAEHLALARVASSGRSSQTVYGGHEHTLRQTLIAFTAGQRMNDHRNPGEATLQVLHGRVRLITPTTELDASTDDLVTIPDEVHSLTALEDSAVLLTVGKHGMG
jgi:quercetin dioxygenase-like cupin family protein